MGKGYSEIYPSIEFRRELNRINAENRYNELLQETYRMKEKDYQNFLDDYYFDKDTEPVKFIDEMW